MNDEWKSSSNFLIGAACSFSQFYPLFWEISSIFLSINLSLPLY